MIEFSIELASERIPEARTKEYFSEVLTGFITGSYRSSIVMLWSVVVADLIFKLQKLRDLYHDETAESILKAIEEKQERNPTDSDWEKYLLKEIKSRTQLLEPPEYENLVHLQKLRHLSAHPALKSGDMLYAPNKECARAAIRNALEAVLLKPPLFSRRIATELAVDLASSKHLLIDDKQLSSYLEAKYLNNFHPNVERTVVKTLWKFCFVLDNEEANSNRVINWRALQCMYKRNPRQFDSIVQYEPDYFSSISPKDEPIRALIGFLTSNPRLFCYLTDSARAPVECFAKENPTYFVCSTFLSRNMASHIESVKSMNIERISKKTWCEFTDICQESGCAQDAYEMGIQCYINSWDYDSADTNFVSFLQEYIENYDEGLLRILLEGIEKNDQTYGRGQALRHHSLVADKVLALGMGGLEVYPHFLYRLPVTHELSSAKEVELL